jgi:hypothetical protein
MWKNRVHVAPQSTNPAPDDPLNTSPQGSFLDASAWFGLVRERTHPLHSLFYLFRWRRAVKKLIGIN